MDGEKRKGYIHMMRAAIFTIDTGLYRAKEEGAAAAALKRLLEQAGFEVKAAGALPQEKNLLVNVIQQLADSATVELILTTGSAGFLKEDCAPEAVKETADRMLPGIAEALRAYNLRYSKKAMLESLASGIRNKTLIINLPESAKTAKEDIEYILPEIVHVVESISL